MYAHATVYTVVDVNYGLFLIFAFFWFIFINSGCALCLLSFVKFLTSLFLFFSGKYEWFHKRKQSYYYTGKIAACEFHVKFTWISREIFHVNWAVKVKFTWNFSREIHVKFVWNSREFLFHVNFTWTFSREFHFYCSICVKYLSDYILVFVE